MATISGHIGESISFSVQNAGGVTGVYFGGGSANFEIINDDYIKAWVPNDAGLDNVSFYKLDKVNVYSYLGSGYEQTGALDSLTFNLVSSGALGTCASGEVIYSNTYDVSGVCIVSATGATETDASGKLFAAYDSGLCGNDVDGYTNQGYSQSTTKLDNFDTFINSSGDWLALGDVQDTGNFVYQTASVQVSCLETQVEQTSYKFIPIPNVTHFIPLRGAEGDGIGVVGEGFSGVSGATISGVSIDSFQVVDSFTISGFIPSGDFNNKVVVHTLSGITAESPLAFKTFEGFAGQPDEAGSFSLFPANIVRIKGQTDPVVLFGENISGLTSGYLLDENAVKIDLLSNPSFDYSSDSALVPISGLDEGVYDIVLNNPSETASVFDFISIKDGPSITNTYVPIYENLLIDVPQEFESAAEASSNLAGAQWAFTLLDDADRVCLFFSNLNISAGETKFKLERILDDNYSSDRSYTFQGLGASEQESWQEALSQYSELNPNVCEVVSSGTQKNLTYPAFVNSTLVTGVLTGVMEDHPIVVPLRNQSIQDFNVYASVNTKLSCGVSGYVYTSGSAETAGYPSIYLTHSSYSTGVNAADILQQLTSYPDYEIVAWDHTGIIENQQNPFASGFSWPYPSTLLNDTSSEPWENVLHSGLEVLSSDNWGLNNLTSGYDILNSTNQTNTGSFVVTGNTSSDAVLAMESIRVAEYLECQTGNLNFSKVLIVESSARDYSGHFWGYC